jgi:hypothetical protein
MPLTASPLPHRSLAVDAGVIEEARTRQRRQRTLAAGATVAALLAAGLAALVGPSGLGRGPGDVFGRTPTPPGESPTASPAKRVLPAVALAQPPSMGVACRSGVCDWVGLAVWLRQPAVSVSATIAGRPVRLVMTNAYPRPGARATFVGYLRPFRLVTSARLDVGSGPTSWATSLGQEPTPAVNLRIRYRNGRTLTTSLDLPLQPGWG